MLANKSVLALKPYPVSSHAAWEHKERANVLKLDWNESTISPSPKVLIALQNYLENGYLNWYPDTNNEALLNAIANYSQLPIENVQYFASSDSLHEYVVRTFMEPLNRALIIGPTYDNFRAVVESNGGLVDHYNLDKTFSICYDNLRAHIKLYQPKIVYICNPNNPTGTIHPFDELKKTVSSCPEVLFVVDEAYFEFVDQTCSNLVERFGNIIISRTFSKAFGLASFRVGYCLSCTENIGYLTKIRNPKNITMMSQIAALAALNDLEYMQKYVCEVNLSKQNIVNELQQLGLNIFHSGGNYIFMHLQDSDEKVLSNKLLENNIYIRNYSHVAGANNCVRLTIGTRNQMVPIINIFKDVFRQKL